jgi:hypothetical protein
MAVFATPEYMARLRRELRCGPQRRDKYQVVAAVVNLTGAPQSDTLEWKEVANQEPNNQHRAT